MICVARAYRPFETSRPYRQTICLSPERLRELERELLSPIPVLNPKDWAALDLDHEEQVRYEQVKRMRRPDA